MEYPVEQEQHSSHGNTSRWSYNRKQNKKGARKFETDAGKEEYDPAFRRDKGKIPDMTQSIDLDPGRNTGQKSANNSYGNKSYGNYRRDGYSYDRRYGKKYPSARDFRSPMESPYSVDERDDDTAISPGYNFARSPQTPQSYLREDDRDDYKSPGLSYTDLGRSSSYGSPYDDYRWRNHQDYEDANMQRLYFQRRGPMRSPDLSMSPGHFRRDMYSPVYDMHPRNQDNLMLQNIRPTNKGYGKQTLPNTKKGRPGKQRGDHRRNSQTVASDGNVHIPDRTYCPFTPDKTNFGHFTIELSHFKQLSSRPQYNEPMLVNLFSGKSNPYKKEGETAFEIFPPKKAGSTVVEGRIVGLGMDMIKEKKWLRSRIFVHAHDKQNLIEKARRKVQGLSPQKLKPYELLRAKFQMVDGIPHFKTLVTYFPIKEQAHLIMLHEHFNNPSVKKYISKMNCVVQLKHEKRKKGLALFVETTGSCQNPRAPHRLEKLIANIQERIDIENDLDKKTAMNMEKKQLEIELYENATEYMRQIVKSLMDNRYFGKNFVWKARPQIETLHRIRREIFHLWMSHYAIGNEKMLEKWIRQANQPFNGYEVDTYVSSPKSGKRRIYLGHKHRFLFRFLQGAKNILDVNQAFILSKIPYYNAEDTRKSTFVMEMAISTVDSLVAFFPSQYLQSDIRNADFFDCYNRIQKEKLLKDKGQYRSFAASRNTLIRFAMKRNQQDEDSRHLDDFRSRMNIPNIQPMRQRNERQGKRLSTKKKKKPEQESAVTPGALSESNTKIGVMLQMLQKINSLAKSPKVTLHPKEVDIDKLQFVSPPDRAKYMVDYNQAISKISQQLREQIRRHGDDCRLNNCQQWENFRDNTIQKLKKELMKRHLKKVDILLSFRADGYPRFRWRGCRVFILKTNDFPSNQIVDSNDTSPATPRTEDLTRTPTQGQIMREMRLDDNMQEFYESHLKPTYGLDTQTLSTFNELAIDSPSKFEELTMESFEELKQHFDQSKIPVIEKIISDKSASWRKHPDLPPPSNAPTATPPDVSAATPPSAPMATPSNGKDEAQLKIMQTQIEKLTEQMNQLQKQLANKKKDESPQGSRGKLSAVGTSI